MSDEPEGGNGDRATVALALAEIRGLHQLTRAEFVGVNRRLDSLEGLPERVTRLETTIALYARMPVAVGGLERVGADHEHRLIDIERSEDAERASRAIHWPTIAATVFVVAMGFIGQLLFH